MYRKMFVLSLIVVATLVLSGCGVVAPAPPERIGIAITMPDLARDMGFGNAIDLAVEEYNAQEGVIPVEAVWVTGEGPPDDPFVWTSPEVEQAAVQRAIDDPEVLVIVGGTSNAVVKASLSMANEAGLAYIVAGASWTGLTQPGYGPGEPGIYYPTGVRSLFRVVARDDTMAGLMVDFVIEELDPESAYLVDNIGIGQGFLGQTQLAAMDAGLEVTYEEVDIPALTQDEIEALAARIVDTQPDVLITLASARLIWEVRALDPDLPIAGFAMIDITAVDPPEGHDFSEVEGVYYIDPYPRPDVLGTDVVLAFSESYQAAYGETDPSIVGQLATMYEITRVALYAIEQAEEPTREGVLHSLQNLGAYNGVYGDWYFTPEGDMSSVVAVFNQLQDGEWVTVSDLVVRSQD